MVRMNVGHAHRRLDLGIIYQFDLLAGLSRLLGHLVGHGPARLHAHGFQRFEIGGIGLDGDFENLVSRSREFGILRNEIGLAGEAKHITLPADDLRHDDPFGSRTVGALGSDQLALLADDILSLGIVALGLDQRFLAVHHARSGHLAELGHISSFYFHRSSNF